MAGGFSIEKHSSLDSVKELKPGSRDIYVILCGDMGENGWYIGDVWFQIYVTNGTKIELIEYSIDGSGWQLYDPFKITTEGFHSLKIRIYDQDWNEWNFSFDFKIDLSTPIIVLQKEILSFHKIRFDANVSDSGSGVWRVEFYLDDGQKFTDYNSPFEWIWIGTGNHTMTAKVFDWAGRSASSSISTTYTKSQSQKIPDIQRNSHVIHSLLLHHHMMGYTVPGFLEKNQ
jgi:hypothetical protein